MLSFNYRTISKSKLDVISSMDYDFIDSAVNLVAPYGRWRLGRRRRPSAWQVWEADFVGG